MSVKRVVAIALAVAVLAFFAGWRVGPLLQPAIAPPSYSASMPLFNEVLQTIERDYVNAPRRSRLIEGAINGMTASLGDPYTAYYTPAQYRQLLDQLNGEFFGVGVEISQIGQYIVIDAVLPSSPAEAGHLREGDRITEVDGRSLIGVDTTQAATEIRGPEGSKVTLTILRAGKSFSVTLTRQPVELQTIQARWLPGKIAYIQLNQVSQDASAIWKSTLAKYQAGHPRGWILDLRNDPGGLVDQAVSIARTMVPSGKIVSFKGRVDNEVFVSKSGDRFSAPMVVLVNGGTASAAEILTGVLQDDHLATVIGTRTFGKGIAQQIVPMENGGVVKVTVARWYTPKGRNIEGTGLAPDLYVDGTVEPVVMAERLLGDHVSFASTLRLGSLTAVAGSKTVILDEAPVVRRGQLYVSLEGATELFGVNAVTSKSGNHAILRYAKMALGLSADATKATLDGRPTTVPAPFLKDGVLMVPVRSLLDMTGLAMARSGDVYTFTGGS